MVLLGDLVNSRGMERRDLYKRVLDGVILDINRRRERDLLAPLKIIRGIDEVGCVPRETGAALAVIRDLSAGVLPRRYRFGLARGAIDIDSPAGDVAEMDGPAFHEAAGALSRARSNRTFIEIGKNVELTDELDRIMRLQGSIG